MTWLDAVVDSQVKHVWDLAMKSADEVDDAVEVHKLLSEQVMELDEDDDSDCFDHT